MDYSAEEIQFIIIKTGIYKNQEVLDYLKIKLSNLNSYTKGNNFYYYKKSMKRIILEYNINNQGIILSGGNFINYIYYGLKIPHNLLVSFMLPYLVDNLKINATKILEYSW